MRYITNIISSLRKILRKIVELISSEFSTSRLNLGATPVRIDGFGFHGTVAAISFE